MSTIQISFLSLLLAVCGVLLPERLEAGPPDLVVLNGNIVSGRADGTIYEAMAINEGRILRVGTSAEISKLAGATTEVLDLKGGMVLPGLYEPHVHPQMVRLAYLQEPPYVELQSIREIQDWVQARCREIPADDWIRIPRTEITRLKEHRHPTVEELDAGCGTHPVVFYATQRYVFNSLGFAKLGVTDGTLALSEEKSASADKTSDDAILGLQAQGGLSRPVLGARIINGRNGKPQFLITTDEKITSKFASRETWNETQARDVLLKLHQAYNSAGITTIFERGAPIQDYRTYKELHDAQLLTLRVRFTILQDFKSGTDIEEFVRKENIWPHHGDDWLSVGTLKIVADGGIHFGNTYLSEPYGPKRASAYISDPDFRGDLFYSVEQMADIFGAAAKLGWQMAVHITGDAGVDAVLSAMERVDRNTRLSGRRFLLIHAYFPTDALAARTAALGMGVDTHPNSYYLDAPFINEVYGRTWAERFIGIGIWAHAGVPVMISSDHMVGLDPDHSMNSYNPFRAMYAAVTRKTRSGEIFGSDQKMTRLGALRAMTAIPAYLNFEDDKSGTLEVGKFGDFVVIDRDFLRCPEEEIIQIKALRTVVAGRTVYQR